MEKQEMMIALLAAGLLFWTIKAEADIIHIKGMGLQDNHNFGNVIIPKVWNVPIDNMVIPEVYFPIREKNEDILIIPGNGDLFIVEDDD